MDPFWNRYYKLNRIFLSPIGLWPHGNRKLKPIQVIVSVVILVSSVVTQLLKLFTTEYDLDIVLTNLSFTIPSIIYVVKYKTFYSQANRLIRIMELIQNDWNSLTSEKELYIVRKFTDTGRRYIIVFAFLILSAVTIYILYCLLPNILDVVAPLNESRPRKLPYLAEYFVNEQEYFNGILTHMIVVFIVEVFVFVGTETTNLAYAYHIFGMFEVASYRIKHALDESIVLAPTMEWNICVRARIIAAVEVHQKAIQFSDYLKATFTLSSFVILCLGVASVSVNLFRAAKLVVSLEEAAVMTIFVCGQFYYMFLANYVGQKLIDHSIHIVDETYNIPWYETSVQSQKLLLFIMRRSIRSCKVVLGGVYTISLEGFATLSSMSISYFTVLCSTR